MRQFEGASKMAWLRSGLLGLSLLSCLAVTAAVAQAQGATFAGVVLGPDERPVAGARVMAFDTHVQPWWRPIEVASDAAGAFSVTLPAAGLDEQRPILALKPGLALSWKWARPGAAITLRLGADPVARPGRVVTLDGKPIAGADVAVIALSVQRPGEFTHVFLSKDGPLSHRSDEQGRFSFDGLPRDIVLSLLVGGEGYATVQVRSDTEAAGKIIVTLPPEATIAGHVTRDGQGLGAVRVLCQPDESNPECTGYDSQLTAADGSYMLRHLPPGTYNVLIDPPPGLAGKAIDGLVLPAGRNVTGADFALTPGGLVRGLVTEEQTGKAVPEVLVASYGPARPQSGAACQNTLTGKDGRYELRLPPGRNMVYYQGSGGYTVVGERQRWVEVREGETTAGIDFVLKPPDKISGQVYDPEGQPAAKAEVSVFGQFGMPGRPVEVSAEGKFGLVNPVSGEATQGLPLLALDRARGLAALAWVKPGQKSVVLRLQAGAYVAGSAVDVSGKPIPRVWFPISLQGEQSWGYAVAEGHTDDKGQVRIGPLPAGAPLELQRESRSSAFTVDEQWWEKIGDLTLKPGEERRLPPLVLNLEGRSVKLCVLDEQQQPVPGALVYTTGLREATPTDAQGQLQLKGLPMRGKITLLAMHPTLPLFATATVDPDWEFWPGLILKPLCRVRGRVQDKAGKPLTGAALLFEDYVIYDWVTGDSLLGQRLRAAGSRGEVTTDAHGAWEAACFVEGLAYDVLMRHEDGTASRLGRFTAQGGAEPQDVGVMAMEPPADQPR